MGLGGKLIPLVMEVRHGKVMIGKVMVYIGLRMQMNMGII